MYLVVDEEIISEAVIMTEKAKAIVDTVTRDCFEQSDDKNKSFIPHYKDNVILIEMAVSLLYDVQQLLKEVAKGRKE